MRNISLSVLILLFLLGCTSKSIQSTTADESFSRYWEEKLNESEGRTPANLIEELFPSKEAQTFSEQDLLKIASSEKLSVKKAHLTIDNDAAFRTKIEAIRSAKPGETIRMAYYIFNPDHSSALIYSEILQAAKRGVKVKILADLLTNYFYLDLFRMLSASPNIEIKFFGRPSNLVLRDIHFLTLPCPEAAQVPSSTFCSDAKWKQIKEPFFKQDFYGKAFLAGILAKDPSTLKIGFVQGQEIDLKRFLEGPGTTPEEKEKLFDLLELVFRWKVKGEGMAGFKARLATLLYASQVNPILNELFGRVPLSQPGKNSIKDWEHLSDFSHHKLLLVGDRFIQLGGRNIENSYHMAPNPLIHRYVFKDADVSLEMKDGGQSVINSFEDLFNFSPMVIGLVDLLKLAPNDLVANSAAVGAAYEKCSAVKPNRTKFQECFRKNIEADRNYKNTEERITDLNQTLAKKLREYNDYANETHKTEHWSKDGDDLVPTVDLKKATIVYLENVPYNRELPEGQRKRIMGTRHGYEQEDGKYIHVAWNRGLQNACVEAQSSEKETRVILHSAYFLPPASMIQDMTKMFDGTWNCKNVRVTILSNSFVTTDLNMVNSLGQYQMTAFFNLYSHADSLYPDTKNRRAKFEYYEYKKFNGGDDISLHKKVHILGNDVFIGSANGDVRSYYMDTNNGIYFQNVPNFAKEYTTWVDSLLEDKKITVNRTSDFIGDGRSISKRLLAMHKQDIQLVEDYLDKKGWNRNLNAESKAKIYEKLEETGKIVFDLTRKIMSPRYVESGNNIGQKRLGQTRAANSFNRMMQLL